MGLDDVQDEGGRAAASKAVPPGSRTAIAAAEASQWVEVTIPTVPCSTGRVVKSGGGVHPGGVTGPAKPMGRGDGREVRKSNEKVLT